MSDNSSDETPNEPTQGLYLFAFLFAFSGMCYIMLTKGNFFIN